MVSAACSGVRRVVSIFDLGSFGRFVRRVDAGEVLQLAAPRLLVQALRIARLRHLERRVDEHLEELALRP